MNILLTGVRGTLASVLKQELRRRGHSVFGVDLMHGSDPREIRADVAEWRQVERIFPDQHFDLVYHLAAEFGRHNGAMFSEQLWRTNQIGTRNIIRACIDWNARLILAGSSEAYGNIGQPFTGTGGHFSLSETLLDDTVAAFHNEYALSKWCQERQVFIAAQNEGLNAVVLRFFNAYGPGEYYSPYRSVVCLFCSRLLHDFPITIYRNYRRVFMWVGDWATTVANAAERFDNLPRQKEMQGSRPGCVPVYNIGGKEFCSVEEMCEIVIRCLVKDHGKSESALRRLITFVDKEQANVTDKLPDIQMAEADLSHMPTVTLEQGIPATLSWLRSNYISDGQYFADVDLEMALLEPHIP